MIAFIKNSVNSFVPGCCTSAICTNRIHIGNLSLKYDSCTTVEIDNELKNNGVQFLNLNCALLKKSQLKSLASNAIFLHCTSIKLYWP